MRNGKWRVLRVMLAAVALTALVAGGTADARRRGGFGKFFPIDGSQVEDGGLTGADIADDSLKGVDIDESTLVCNFPGCGGVSSSPSTPGALKVTFGPVGQAQFGSATSDGQFNSAEARSVCPAGTTVINGAYNIVGRDRNEPVSTVESYIADGNAWAVRVGTAANVTLILQVVAVCLGTA